MTGRKLGRGLDMLIAREDGLQRAEVLQLSPAQVSPNPAQPRKRFSINELEQLKASISKDGVLQPILVRKVGDSYQLVAGERRLRAAQDLGIDTIPAMLVSLGDERMLELALIENIQREDLNPIELASAYHQLLETRKWTQEQLSQALGLSRAGVANTLRLLELPEDVQNALIRGQITMGHAKVLLSVSDPKEQRLLFERIAEEKLSVRDLEEGARDVGEKDPAGRVDDGKKAHDRGGPKRSPHIMSLEERLAEKLGTKVRIREKSGKGKVTIDFYSAEDFERIRAIILSGSEQ